MLLNRRAVMMQPKAMVIYSLNNYVLDGSVNTAIDTGLQLYNSQQFPNGFRIEVSLTPTAKSRYASYVRCRESDPPHNGCNLRWTQNVAELQIQANSYSLAKSSSLNVLADAAIEYDGIKHILTLKGTTQTFNSGTVVSNWTLLIGGEKDSSGWMSDRFSQATIHSLRVIKL